MRIISAKEIVACLDYSTLIGALRDGFTSDIVVPERHHHNFSGASQNRESTLLLMPAWKAEQNLGVKVVTVSPDNSKSGLPSIHGLYIYFDAVFGKPLAVMDAGALTKIRTAAASALASFYLSRKNVSSMTMIGTGALAPELVKAHCKVRNIRKVQIWGRDIEKAAHMASDLNMEGVEVQPTDDLETAIRNSDLISSATLSHTPLIKGKWLTQGSHVDLVGSYKPDMREADDEVISRSSLYVDALPGALKETGDLAIPLQTGVLQKSDIRGDLFGLCRGMAGGRRNDHEITCFKSVGHALEDLIAAKMVYENISKDA
ncbi:MAG: ornithine cyclodeaminase family protein [Bacteroidetes bacterium]|nr:ornithine cyclodeaminase family protein [Bacteroidota bacterium]